MNWEESLTRNGRWRQGDKVSMSIFKKVWSIVTLLLFGLCTVACEYGVYGSEYVHLKEELDTGVLTYKFNIP